MQRDCTRKGDGFPLNFKYIPNRRVFLAWRDGRVPLAFRLGFYVHAFLESLLFGMDTRFRGKENKRLENKGVCLKVGAFKPGTIGELFGHGGYPPPFFPCLHFDVHVFFGETLFSG